MICLREVSLYIHIPFCSRKCDYCHFFVLPDQEPLKKQFLSSLKIEWQLRAPMLQDLQIVSIYFGGGTPALLAPEAIGQILSWIKEGPASIAADAEITLEANPENLSKTLMQEFAAVGVNRVSIGIQSLDETLLVKLTRTHSAAKAIAAVEDTYSAGIENISIDLMYDLPGQTIQSWEKTLRQAVLLPISHLSLYNLTIEPHTAFFKHRQALQATLPDQDASLLMHQMAQEILEEALLKQYEISAFARRQRLSKHNVGYWTGRPFLGLGPSAFSYWNGSRFRNVCNLSKYTKALQEGRFPVDFEETLEPDARINELLAIALRLIEGVDLTAFEKMVSSIFFDRISANQEASATISIADAIAGSPLAEAIDMVDGDLAVSRKLLKEVDKAEKILPKATRKSLDKLLSEGLLIQKENRISLSTKGLLFYDSVAEEII